MEKTDITVEDMKKASGIIGRLGGYYKSKVVGQQFLGYSLLVSMITNQFRDLQKLQRQK